jgi:enoyl-CoA hydratase/carnithine racemase
MPGDERPCAPEPPVSMSDPASHATLDYGVDGRIARATFARPQEGNTLSEQVLDDLNDVVASVQGDPEIRTLVIRGSGDAFCAGIAEEFLATAFDDLEYFEHVLTRVAATGLSLEALEVPVIAAVNGRAIVAADEATLGDTHTATGMIPTGGGSVRLPRIVGAQRAREIIYSGRLLSGTEAATLGLALASVPLAELDRAVEAIAAMFTDKSRRALSACKRQINGTLGLDTPSGVEYERAESIRYLREPQSDALEGFRAEQENRPPSWA